MAGPDQPPGQDEKHTLIPTLDITSLIVPVQATRAEMEDLWRGPTSRLDKMKNSLQMRMPPTWSARAIKEFLAKLDATVRTNWSIYALQVWIPSGISQPQLA